ncbi:hypothetical protein HDV02_005681 [Globomyces sp. JEL0801]|nr:hypothetical protein HDV02_005681 [Globomyces sp. JEL0801]
MVKSEAENKLEVTGNENGDLKRSGSVQSEQNRETSKPDPEAHSKVLESENSKKPEDEASTDDMLKKDTMVPDVHVNEQEADKPKTSPQQNNTVVQEVHVNEQEANKPGTSPQQENVKLEDIIIDMDDGIPTFLQKHLPITTGVMNPILATLMLIAATGAALLYGTIYLGPLWNPLPHFNNVPFAYLNHDKGFDFTAYKPYESAVLRMTNNQSFGDLSENLLFKSDSPLSQFLKWVQIEKTTTVEQLKEQLEIGDYWGIVYIPENFSNAFLTNLQDPNTQLPNPNYLNMTVDVIYNQARQLTICSIAITAISDSLSVLSSSFANKLLLAAERDRSVGYKSLLTSPRFISQPIHKNIINTHPIPFMGLNFATYLPCLVLWIAGVVIVSLVFRIFGKNFDNVAHVHHRPLFIVKFWVSGVLFGLFNTFVASFAFFLLVLSLNNGDSSFVQPEYSSFQVILFLWLMTSTFTCSSAVLCALIGIDYFAILSSLLLILQFATSSAILEPVVMPGAGRIGYIFPFSHSVKTLKCMFLGSQCHEMGSHILVIIVWLICTLLLTLVIVGLTLRRRILVSLETNMTKIK